MEGQYSNGMISVPISISDHIKLNLGVQEIHQIVCGQRLISSVNKDNKCDQILAAEKAFGRVGAPESDNLLDRVHILYRRAEMNLESNKGPPVIDLCF